MDFDAHSVASKGENEGVLLDAHPVASKGEDEGVLLDLIQEMTARMRITFGKEVVFGIGGRLTLADVQCTRPAW